MHHYALLFEFSTWWKMGIAGVVIFLVLFALFLKIFQTSSDLRRAIQLVFGLPIFAFFAFGLEGAWERYRETWHRHDSGTVTVVEGAIHSTKLICNEGAQSFSVRDVNFGPRDCEITPGFSPGITFGLFKVNLVSDGMIVRVEYFPSSWGENVITKIDIRTD